jgi:hypothetical protein
LKKAQNALIWIAIAAGVIALVVFDSYSRAALHPHYFSHDLPRLMQGTLSFQWSDFIRPFYPFAGDEEHRPRFLMYFVELLDHHLRLWLYRYVLIPPTLSIAWIPQALAVYLLYRFALHFTGNRNAGLLTVAVYMSSVGFLGSFAVLFLPGKGLSNVVYICVLYLASEIDRREPGKPLFEVAGWERWAILLVLFLGLFLDEMGIFAFALIPVVFPHRFGRNPARHLGLLAMPLALFLLFSLAIAPMVTEAYFGYRFKYLDTLLQGGTGLFSLGTLAKNFFALLGSAIVPLQLGEPINMYYVVGVPILLLCILSMNVRVALATSGFILFFALVMGRHGGWGSGLYYGSVFAVFLALLIGTAYARRPIVLIVALVVVGVQINNFSVALARFAEVHNGISASIYSSYKFEGSRPSKGELSGIREAWKAGQLAKRLEQPISSGSLYLVAELRYLDAMKSKTP